jgi:Rieske Fe-S protein
MSDSMRGDRPAAGDARSPVDARIDILKPRPDAEQMTIAPDWRPMDQQPVWRADFPIDVPQDQYVERREFMKFMVLTSLALTVGQFWIVAQNWWRRRRGLSEIRRIASLDQLPVGGLVTFTYPGAQDDCVLIRTRDDALLAYSQRCTHLSCAVRPRLEEDVIHCPCHEGYFDLRSGRPIAGPPRRPLDQVRLQVRGNEIYATGIVARTI